MEKGKKKLLTRGKCARQESGEGKGWQPSFPLSSQLCGSLCSPVFIFFAVSLCFFASFPYYDDWSQAISATSTRFCCTMVPISLLVYWSTTLKKGKFWGGETWLLCSILAKMDTRIQHKIRIFLPSKVKDFYLFYFLVKVKELDSNLNYSLVGLRINTYVNDSKSSIFKASLIHKVL